MASGCAISGNALPVIGRGLPYRSTRKALGAAAVTGRPQRTLTTRDQGFLQARSSVITRIVGGPPLEIEAACASASFPSAERAHSSSAASEGKVTSELA